MSLLVLAVVHNAWHLFHAITLLVMRDYRKVRRIEGLRHAPHVNVGSWV